MESREQVKKDIKDSLKEITSKMKFRITIFLVFDVLLKRECLN